MNRKIMESLGAMLLIDGIAFMVLLLVAVLNASPPWVAVSAMEFIALHPDLLALVILSGPFVVLIFGVCRYDSFVFWLFAAALSVSAVVCIWLWAAIL